jgi:hypothetical protein
MNIIWDIDNNCNLGILAETTYFEYIFPTKIDPETVTFKVITGKLPDGLNIDNYTLSGYPFEVARPTEYRFVIRATSNTTISDRTFILKVIGIDDPIWLTETGYLPIGLNSSFYILDESYVDFRLSAIDYDTSTGQVLKYWIASNDGLLPPGLTLADDGRIYGWVEPLLLIEKPSITGFYGTTYYDTDGYDYGILNTDGYDSLGYDNVQYDLSVVTPKPKKLNRNYEFYVTLTDGDSTTRRKFIIYVVGDDSLTVDTTSTFSDEFAITSDSAAVRQPVWKTPSDLGIHRASNYETLQLEIYPTVNNEPVSFFLNAQNPDGTLCILPPGLQLDTLTADLFGVMPYQPAVTKTYTFTLTAVRIGHLQEVNVDFNDSEIPLVINESRVVYRNTDLEGDTMHRVFSSLVYIDFTTGSKLYQVEQNGSWVYVNNDQGIMLYSQLGLSDPTGNIIWYTDSNLITVSPSPPSISLLNTNTSVYTEDYESASSSRTFTITIIGNIETAVYWQTPPNLGTIEANQISTLSVSAICSNPNIILYYELSNNIIGYELLLNNAGDIVSKTPVYTKLPNGLILDSRGNLIGRPQQFDIPNTTSLGITSFHDDNSNYLLTFDNGSTTFDRVFSIEIIATDPSGNIAVGRNFLLQVMTPNNTRYCDIIVSPLLSSGDRELFRNFINDTDIFDHDLIFRPDDYNYGIRNNLAMLIYAGIKTQPYDVWDGLITKRKNFIFGDIAVAKAKWPGTDNVIYEVIYLNMIDPIESSTLHLPTVIKTSNELIPYTIDTTTITIDQNDIFAKDTYSSERFPSSISLWRDQIDATGINDRHYLPLWMRTIQDGMMTELDYLPAVPICFCKPGASQTIIANIKNSKFNFNNIYYDIDRFIINEVDGYYTDIYLPFRNDRTVTT